MTSADYWLEKLMLKPHPEGGHYKVNYKSQEYIDKEALPDCFSGDRPHSTAIYFLLEKDDFSAFHRIQQDELWHYYDGDSLTIHIIDLNASYIKQKLGLNLEKGEFPQIVVKAGSFFAVELNDKTSYCLSGCTVAPGFNFDDFEMPSRSDLIELFPLHKNLIRKFTKIDT